MQNKDEKDGCFFENQTISTPTYKEQAYNLIKEAILYRRLEAGVIYSQDGLCVQLGISKTPVREALLELQKEGYINFLRGRGMMIRPITPDRARDIAEMRYFVEMIGGRLAAARAGEEQLAELCEKMEQMESSIECGDTSALYKMDRAFHQVVFECAGNACLLEYSQNLRDQFLRVETQTAFDSAADREAIIREHRRIYQAVLNHDQKAVGEATDEHSRNTYDRTMKNRNKD